MYFCLSFLSSIMAGNKDLSELVTNIGNVLKHYSVAEINNELRALLKKKPARHDEISVVFEIICSTFNVSPSQLKRKNARGAVQELKQVAFCIFKIDLNFSMRAIANDIFDLSGHICVFDAVKRLKEVKDTIKPDMEFKQKYLAVREQLVNSPRIAISNTNA